LVLLLAVMLLTGGAVVADLEHWQVKCGLGDNDYPYGNDFSARFGVDPDGTYDYDGRDAAHPPVADPQHDLAFIFHERYYRVYRDQVPHDVGPFVFDSPLGWPPDDRHGDGTAPDFPVPGLLKDTRMPFDVAGSPEIWLVYAYAPCGPGNPDEEHNSSTCSFIWEWNTDDDEMFHVPASMDVRIWGNADLESAGIVGDLVLSDYGPGIHKIEGIVQWGWNNDYDVPIKHEWVIQATIVPEPAVAQIAGLVFGIAGLGIARFRRK
jgi:hypothetical protein